MDNPDTDNTGHTRQTKRNTIQYNTENTKRWATPTSQNNEVNAGARDEEAVFAS